VSLLRWAPLLERSQLGQLEVRGLAYRYRVQIPKPSLARNDTKLACLHLLVRVVSGHPGSWCTGAAACQATTPCRSAVHVSASADAVGAFCTVCHGDTRRLTRPRVPQDGAAAPDDHILAESPSLTGVGGWV
jgi:hypothetical protein